MKMRRQSSAPARGVTFTHGIDDKRRIIAANEPMRGPRRHRLIVAWVAAVLLIATLSLLLGR